MTGPLLFPPTPALAPWIHHVMVMSCSGAFPIPAVLHPNIVLFARGRGWIGAAGTPPADMPRACLKGPCLAPRVVSCEPGSVFISILFKVGFMADALGPGIAQFRDRIVALDDVFAPADVERLMGRMDESFAPAAWVALAQDFLAARLRHGHTGSRPGALAEAHLLARPAAEIAASLGVGVRQLERRLDHALGANLREVRRMYRFGHCLARLAAGSPRRGDLTRVAHDLGYYDHPHLDREFRALAGAPPGALLDGAATDAGAWLYRLGKRQFHDLFMP